MAETTTDRSSGPRVVAAPAEWMPPRGRLRWQLADGELMVAALRASGETPVAFAPVRVTSAPPAVSGLEVVIGGAVVRVDVGFDGDLLRRVVAALGEASC